MSQQRAKRLAPISESLNKNLMKQLETFSHNTEWTDINNWLLTVESALIASPSPFIADKILLSKRLNQCMNPVLPAKVHECVLRIHELIFKNIRASVQGNRNDYIRMLAENLGIYSVSILPYFTHTDVLQHRIMCLKLINVYYLDLGKQLIPLLPGLLKSIFPVYTETINQQLISLIEQTLFRLLAVAGRRYVIGITWSVILKYHECKQGGIKFLGKAIDKMEYIKGEQEFSESQRFSDIQREIDEEERLQKLKQQSLDYDINGQPVQHAPRQRRKSMQIVQNHINQQTPSKEQLLTTPLSNVDASPINQLTANGVEHPKDLISEFQNDSKQKINKMEIIKQEFGEQSVVQNASQKNKSFDHKQTDEIKYFTSITPANARLLRSDDQIKLDKVPQMLTEGIKRIREGIDQNSPTNNYPNSSTLVVSALISCLQQDNQLIKRETLDFMFSHLRIKSELLTHNDKLILVQALIRMFKKKEISTSKRVNRWIFGKEDQQNRYVITEKNEYVIEYIIHAFKKILEAIPTTEENCSLPLKILQNFYIQHPTLVQRTLSEISIYVLRYIFNFGTRSQKFTKHQQFCDEILKLGKRFLENLPSYYSIIFRSLGNTFIQGIQESNQHKSFEAIKYIDFCYIKLMKHEHNVEQLQYITITLEYISTGLATLSQRNFPYTLFMKDAILLIYNIVARRESVQKYNRKEEERVNEKYFKQTGESTLPIERVKYQQELQQEQQKQKQRYLYTLNKIEIFFVKLGYIVRTQASIQLYEQSFKLCSMAIVKLQMHLPKIHLQTLPRWFTTIEAGVKVSNPLVSLSAIQAMIKCLMWQDKHSIYSGIKTLILQEKSKKTGVDYQRLALEKLWSLLDYPHMHSKIIDLIVGFSRYFPNEFTETVKRSFNTHSAPDKQASIQRFSHFWRLTGYKYKNLLVQNKQFVELNKVGLFRMLDFLDDQNPLVRHAAKNWLMESMSLLTRVIQPLLLQLIVGCTEWYQTPKGIYLIQNVYDTNNIFSTFRRIRSILSNGSYTFLRYVYQADLSDTLEQHREKITNISTRLLTTEGEDQLLKKDQEKELQREPVLATALQSIQKSSEAKPPRMSYLDLLIILTIKYIEGHAIESMGVQFYVGSSGVNASAVQLIQTLLDYIDNPTLCQKLLNYIKQYLFKVLNQVVMNKQYIMQIQLLNLLKNIFFNSSFRKKGELTVVRTFFKNVFTNKMFLTSALNGLHTPFAYVRSQFISFITSCIPLIADFLEPAQCTQCIRHILFTYYKIIKDIGVTLNKNVLEDGEAEDDIQIQVNALSMSKILELQVKMKMEQKFVKFSDNLKQVSKTNEILSVLHGVESILNYFYDLNKLNVKDLGFEFTNPYTFFDTFKSIVTLGLMSSEKSAKLVQKRNFLHNYQTCETLLKDLEPVYETILRSWPLSQQFVRIGSEQFSSIGMKLFNFQRFNKYNKVAKQLIEYVQSQKQSIWGKIYCIMQPMFCKFPTQIIDIYLNLWIRECSDMLNEHGKIVLDHQNTELLMKIMQTIIVNNFPMNIVIHAFLESSAIEQLRQFYLTKQSDKKSANVLDYQIDKKQSKLLYFLYVYFNYVYLNQKELTKYPLLEIWSLIMKAMKPFEKSRSPLAAIWIVEIVNLCSKKYSPKQLLVNERFKSDLHLLVNERLKYMASIASRKEVFFFSDPLSKVSFNEQKTKQVQSYHIVLPLPPTLYEIHKLKRKQKNSSDLLAFVQFRAGETSELQKKYRLYCFKILKKLGLQILQNIYVPEATHWVVVRTCEWISILLPVIEDKSLQNMIYAQCASEILYDILDKARMLFIKQLKLQVLAIFNKDDFFICNTNTLNYWAKIIDWIVSMDKNNETYTEYLLKVSLSSSYFTSENTENKKRIKSFERICFILYSGPKDKYANRIKTLLEKISEVIKKPETTHPALLILILFSIRILILRLSEISLNQLFIDIWPMILTLLMQMFSKQLVRVSISNQISRNPNLLLAALKLIEMISLTNLGEFAHHQWIFICDYFGVNITVPEISTEMNQLFSRRPELASIVQTDQRKDPTPFIYRPSLLNYSLSNAVNYVSQSSEDQAITFKPLKRKIIVKDSFIKDQTQLKLNAMLLMQYMVFVNEYRTQINWTEIEQVIVNDFINLDSFIHQIS